MNSNGGKRWLRDNPPPSRDQLPDPPDPVLEKVAELSQDVGALKAKTELREERERKSQVELAVERGLPADLVATETNVWRRLSPVRNRWPEIAKFDERVAELEMRQAAKADELRDLRDREIATPAADADRLATWQLDGEQEPRPEPELPKIREQIRERQEEWETLTRATERVLAEKTEFVAKHRGRLVKEADSYADEADGRYLELVDQLAEARQDLFAKRRAVVWARLYPGELAGREVADTLAGGRRKPLQAMGLDGRVAADRVLDALRADADWIRTAADAEQKAAMGEGRDPHKPPNTVWVDDPEEKRKRAERMAQWAASR